MRIEGLDSLRFLAALVVVVSHIPLLPPVVSDQNVRAWVIGEGLQRALFNGNAAVVVFFLISGFVIHYPFARKSQIPLAEFWSRRLLRICLPLLCVTAFAWIFGLKDFPLFWEVGFRWIRLSPGEGFLFDTLILWSLVAELIYYLIYPGLHRLARLWGWPALVGLSFGLSWLVVSFEPHARVAGNFTNWLCWLVALPPWVMGCWLADRHQEQPRPSPNRALTRRVWIWRSALLAGSLATKALSSPPTNAWPALTYAWTMPFFGIVALFWLRTELEQASAAAPPCWRERLGLGAYSLYLVHIPARELWSRIIPRPFSETHFLLSNLALLGSVFGVSYIFFRWIELPSWKVARMIAHRFKP